MAKGQYVLYSTADLAPSMNLLREGTCELEAWIPLRKRTLDHGGWEWS